VAGSERLGLRRAWPWLLLSLCIIGLDQWSKMIAVAALGYGERVVVIPGFFDWTMAHNTGVAFSMFAGGEMRWILAAFAALVSIGFMIALTRLRRVEFFTALAFALIIGGAIGNVIDRVRLGYVVDFILWYWRDYHWPAFNVADSAIVCGAAIMILFGWRDARRVKDLT
jgi:signal peptidase II